MSAVQVAISQDFFSAFAAIPRAQQKKVNEFVSKFRHNPTASGINYEKINDAASSDYRSVRIDQDYRGIVLKPERGNTYLLMWVDKHDDAYDWARRHKCAINQETGSLQLYEVLHQAEQIISPPPAQETSFETAPIIRCRDRELLRLGVPEDRLELVKTMRSQQDLDALQNSLPVEAFEALCFLAEGVSLEEVMQEYAVPDGPPVDVEDLGAALERVQSKRRFHVVADEMELMQMLEAPLEQWRVFLHPTQRGLVERHWNGPVRVLGGAGTGKTVVAMHRARWLVRNVLTKDERLLFTTFTRNLAMDIESSLKRLCSPEEMKRIEVTNIDAWVRRFLQRSGQSVRIMYPGDSDFDRCWQRGLQMMDAALDLPESFYQDEWERVILPQRINSRQDYFKASRLGRGVALNRKQRAQIWPVFEEVRLQLHQSGLLTSSDAIYLALDMLERTEGHKLYRSAVVDETQDLGPEALRLIRAMVDVAADDMMVVGDGHQRIYGRKASLASCGIDIRGRGRKLRINYRTSEQIRRFAVAVLEGLDVDDLDDGTDSQDGYRSLFDSQQPALKGFADAQLEASFIVDEIADLVQGGTREEEICVVGRTVSQIRAVARELEERGLNSYTISRATSDDRASSGVRLANMHRVKGLEFHVVFLVGVSQGVLPLEYAMARTQDPMELKNRELGERALLHVAASRAVHSLYVTWVGDPSPYISC